MRRIRAIALISAALLMASCGAEGETTVDLNGTAWTASTINGEAVEHSEITAIFSDGRMAGSAGCNRYSGPYETSGADITFPQAFISTLMACEQETMEQERRFLQALETVTGYEAADGTLTLTADDSEIIVFDEVSQDLSGTSWSILSYLDGNGRVSTIPGTEASVEFDDNTITGTAGCNTMNGSFTADGRALTITELSQTDMYCTEPEGLMDQEAAIGQGLTDAAEYQIEGRTLTIWDADGMVLLEMHRP